MLSYVRSVSSFICVHSNHLIRSNFCSSSLSALPARVKVSVTASVVLPACHSTCYFSPQQLTQSRQSLHFPPCSDSISGKFPLLLTSDDNHAALQHLQSFSTVETWDYLQFSFYCSSSLLLSQVFFTFHIACCSVVFFVHLVPLFRLWQLPFYRLVLCHSLCRVSYFL